MRHPRHKRKRPTADAATAAAAEHEVHPLADPARPIPNLACADRFEEYYRAQPAQLRAVVLLEAVGAREIGNRPSGIG